MMQGFILETLKAIAQHILEHCTLYGMMYSSEDFEDVKSALNHRTSWSIELFRSCFAIHLSNGSSFFVLPTLFFLVIAENMHIHYGRLTSVELQEHAESMGYAMFAILFATPDIGFFIVRVAGLVALSRTPGIAASLALLAMSPFVLLPLLTYAMKLVKRRRRASDPESAEATSGIAVVETQ